MVMQNKKILFFIIFLSLFIFAKGQSILQSDSLVKLCVFLGYNHDYEICIGNNKYTVNNSLGNNSIVIFDSIPHTYFRSETHVRIKTNRKKKVIDCRISYRYDLGCNVLFLYQNNMFFEACFRELYCDSEGFEELIQKIGSSLYSNDTLYRRYDVQEYNR